MANVLREAPWRALFLSHIAKMSSAEFVFSTLHASEDPNSTDAYVPRARYCVYRGMWAQLPVNELNSAPQNEPVYTSDLLTLTTDARMAKVPELFGRSGESHEASGTGGGGPVEAVFYVKETMTQWRFKGQAYIVGPDIDDSSSPGAVTVKRKVGERMRVEGQGDWSWATELTAHFGNLSPGMRGSFKNPAPGRPVSIPPNEPGLGLGQKVSDLHDEIARANFRVVIITPDEVDQVDLTDAARARRWQFRYVGGAWQEEELWP